MDAENEIEAVSPSLPDGGVEPVSPPDPAPPSVRETLDAAAREVRGETDDGSKPADAGKSGGDDRPRDAGGRFLPKTEAGAPVVAATPEKSPPTQSETQTAPSTAPSGPPPGWSAEAKAAFSTASPAIQAAVIKREQEISAGFAQYAQRQQQLEQVIAPRRQYYASDGVSDLQAIDNIWKWFEALKNSPAESFPALAQMFGYNLTPSADANSDQTNPENAALRAEIRRLEGQIGQVAGTFEQQQTEARRAELASWSKDKPYFEKVRVTMGRLMSAGVAGTLDDAYQQAIKVDPTVSAQVAAEEKAAAERKAAEEAISRRGGGNQRRAAVSVRGGSPNGAAGTSQPTSIRESLMKGFAEARGS